MNNHEPLVSICVPTYNSAKFIRQSLDSIVGQTYKNIEIIVSDNASGDETHEILKEYERSCGIRLYRNSNNIGAGNNFNKLIDYAKGEYIAIYHADDLYEPTIVEESVQLLKDETVGLVGTMGTIIDQRNEPIGEYVLPFVLRKKKRLIYDFDEAFFGILKSLPFYAGRHTKNLFFVTPAVMAKKRIYVELGTFAVNDVFKSAGDYEMWLRIARHYNVGIVNKRLIHYRIHGDQGSAKEVRNNTDIQDIVAVLMHYQNALHDKSIKKYCAYTIDKLTLKAAIKQNGSRDFVKSSNTLQHVRSWRLFCLKYLLVALNNLKWSFKPDTFMPHFFGRCF